MDKDENTLEERVIVLYGEVNDGPVVEVVVKDETMWLSQKQMAELFNVSVSTINEYLKNIFDSEELDPNSTIRKFRIVASNRKEYVTLHSKPPSGGFQLLIKWLGFGT